MPFAELRSLEAVAATATSPLVYTNIELGRSFGGIQH